MKDFVKKLFSGELLSQKICTGFCIAIAIVAIIGLITGTTRCSSTKIEEIPDSYAFINEDFYLHENNYKCIVTSAKSLNKIDVYDKNGNIEEKTGNFINVNLSIQQNEESSLKKHKLDCNDFIIKDHSGIIIPMNDIGSLINHDMIDIHYNTNPDGGITSDASFDSIKAYKSYDWYDKIVEPGTTIDISINFEVDNSIKVEYNIVILELDFYYGNGNYKAGTDIVLASKA